jgi:hypothetical protein
MPLNHPVTWHDILAGPFLRDWPVYLVGVAFWFAVQSMAHNLLSLSPVYRKKLTRKEQNELCVRVVAIVNGLTCVRSVYLFVAVGPTLGDDEYANMAEYRSPQALLISYFIWDVIICVRYDWGLAFLLHGVVSVVGLYLSSFPLSDSTSGYFSGVFEMSNGPLHLAALLRAVELLPALAAALDGVFVLMFFGIRIIGGTYVCVNWSRAMIGLLQRGEAHSAVCVVIVVAILWTVLGLQYFWSRTVVEQLMAAAGMGAPAVDVADEKAKQEKRA